MAPKLQLFLVFHILIWRIEAFFGGLSVIGLNFVTL